MKKYTIAGKKRNGKIVSLYEDLIIETVETYKKELEKAQRLEELRESSGKFIEELYEESAFRGDTYESLLQTLEYGKIKRLLVFEEIDIYI